MVLALILQVFLHSLDQLGALLQRLQADIVQHLGNAVEGGEAELIGLLHLEAGGDEAADDQGEVLLQPTDVVVSKAL